jgi:hypothetical protein
MRSSRESRPCVRRGEVGELGGSGEGRGRRWRLKRGRRDRGRRKEREAGSRGSRDLAQTGV